MGEHRVYRYRLGGEAPRLTTYRGGGRRSTVAAKCLCGWQGEGEEAVAEHEALQAVDTTSLTGTRR